jgi:hypothetical protein
VEQFVDMVTSTLGTSQDAARTITGALLNMMADAARPGDVAALFDRLPGATALLDAFRESPPPLPPMSDASLLGSLTNAASTVLNTASTTMGAGTGTVHTAPIGIASLAAVCNDTGIDPSRLPELLALFTAWAGERAGSAVVHRVLDAIPGVAASGAHGSSF